MPDPDYDGAQADHADYKGSGYSRGHLVPAGDMKWDSLAMVESFYFTNCIPQETKFNNGKWNQLEEKTRRWAKQFVRSMSFADRSSLAMIRCELAITAWLSLMPALKPCMPPKMNPMLPSLSSCKMGERNAP